MTTIEELERRVTVLEAAQKETAETQKWMASTLGRIAYVQDEHSQRLERINAWLDSMDSQLTRLESGLTDLRSDLPGMVAGTMRDVLRERRE